MKATFFTIAASALVGAVAAGSHHEHRAAHQVFHELKERTPTAAACDHCVNCTTVYSTWYGEATWAPVPAPAPSTSSVVTTSSTSSTTTSSSTPVSTSTPAPETSTVVPPASTTAPSSTAAASTAASSPAAANFLASSNSNSNQGKSSSSSSSSQLSTGGALYAMAYTQYKGTSPGNSRCASADEVASDISAIAGKGFKTVRSYATDCNGLTNIANAVKANGMKMIVGIYVDGSGVDSSEVNGQISDIKNYFKGDYSIVEMVLLGNEALFNGFTSADALASKMSSLKQDLSSAGYSGPVSTADTLASLQEHEGTLCSSMDVLAANIHPFFNDATSALNAGSFVSQQMKSLQGLCGGGKRALNSETGWPSSGSNNGDAIPSVAEQLIAIESIKMAAGGESVFFSYENDMWKAPGYLNVEASWGCGSIL